MAKRTEDYLKPMNDFLDDRERRLKPLRENVSALEAALDVAKVELAIAEGAPYVVMDPTPGDDMMMLVVFDTDVPLWAQKRVIDVIEKREVGDGR